MNTKINTQKGITLVALVITVIVLIILAGVTLSMVIGDSGIITKAKEAKQNMENATSEEQEVLQSMLNRMNEIESGNGGNVPPNPDGSWNNDKKVNSPDLDGTGLIPIEIGNGGSITEVKDDKENWYNYSEDNRKWANAKTKDGSMWVWIPRYAYKITYTNSSDKSQGGTIDVVFLKNDTNLDKNGQDVTSSSYVDEKGQTGAYIVHPAFKDGTGNGFANGEWDDEIKGIWVSKFEAGYAEGNNSVSKVSSGLKYSGGSNADSNLYGSITTDTTEMYYPVYMPTTLAYNNINIGDAYELSKGLTQPENPYGLVAGKVDSHLMKNSEWGAVAYLAHSKYGRNGDEVTINNIRIQDANSSYYEVTGMAGASISEDPIYTTIDKINDGTSGSYRWYEENGQLASTTGNMYGIYDMSGGSIEYTAGYINNEDESLRKYGKELVNDGGAGTSTKYKSVYAYNATRDNYENNYNQVPNPSRVGEAIWETSTSGGGETSWNSDSSFFPYLGHAFTIRGGSFDAVTRAGVFNFHHRRGDGLDGWSFRTVLLTP